MRIEILFPMVDEVDDTNRIGDPKPIEIFR